MKLSKGFVYYPKKRKEQPIKWLCVCAHQDDCEIMAIDGILKGYYSKKYSFALAVTADGRGSSRSGKYQDYTDEMMRETRIKEQKTAGEIGRYNSIYFLDYSSCEVKETYNESIINDYINLIKKLRPEVIYAHSILDKHKTHLGSVVHLIEAIRRLPKEYRPKKLYGCEVWRGLDWVDDDKKITFNVSRNKKLQKQLLNVFDSQIAGGKSYAEATIGRRYANATYCRSHKIDTCEMVSYAIDLMPLIKNEKLNIKEYALSFVDNLYSEIEKVLH